MGVGEWIVVSEEGMDDSSYKGYAGRITAIHYSEVKVMLVLGPNGFIEDSFEKWIPYRSIRPVTQEEYFIWWRESK